MEQKGLIWSYDKKHRNIIIMRDILTIFITYLKGILFF